jgi:nocturnin
MSTIEVVQFNTLAEALSNPAMNPTAGFTSLAPEDMAWPRRGEALLAHVAKTDADVICLQEVDHFRDTFLPGLSALGYGACYREDEWSPCRRPSDGMLRDGVCIFYKTDRLELCGSHAPFVPRESKDAKGLDAGKSLVARFRVLAPVAETRGPGFDAYVNAMEELLVVTTHLDSKKDERGAARRLEQAKTLLAEAVRFRDFACTNPSTTPIVFCGDLNATPDEPAVAWLKSEERTPRLFSAYERRDGREPPVTTWKIRAGPFKPGEAKMCIDYVFATEGCEVVRVGALAGEEEIGPKALPCAEHPSDHLLLSATIKLGTPTA